MSWGIAETASEIEKIKSESTDYLNGLNSCGVIDWNTYNYAFDFYAKLLMKAYEQGRKDAQPEPCEDAVSRQAVHDLIADYDLSMGQVVRGIHALPSVTPKRKTGKWVYKPNEYDDSTYECSQCEEPWTLIDGTPEENNMKFCPNCGADMRGDRQ